MGNCVKAQVTKDFHYSWYLKILSSCTHLKVHAILREFSNIIQLCNYCQFLRSVLHRPFQSDPGGEETQCGGDWNNPQSFSCWTDLLTSVVNSLCSQFRHQYRKNSWKSLTVVSVQRTVVHHFTVIKNDTSKF